MDREAANRFCCVVCGIETKRHAGWFLVMDNYWLDRVKILSWHPVLARERGMRAVCGNFHLKLLLTHWLNHANLQLIAGGIARMPAAIDQTAAESRFASSSLGKVLGELAVERDEADKGWTGSPEAMECILNTLVGETHSRMPGLEFTSLQHPLGYSGDYAFR